MRLSADHGYGNVSLHPWPVGSHRKTKFLVGRVVFNRANSMGVGRRIGWSRGSRWASIGAGSMAAMWKRPPIAASGHLLPLDVF
jgi:hypothetical protein